MRHALSESDTGGAAAEEEEGTYILSTEQIDAGQSHVRGRNGRLNRYIQQQARTPHQHTTHHDEVAERGGCQHHDDDEGDGEDDDAATTRES